MMVRYMMVVIAMMHIVWMMMIVVSFIMIVMRMRNNMVPSIMVWCMLGLVVMWMVLDMLRLRMSLVVGLFIVVTVILLMVMLIRHMSFSVVLHRGNLMFIIWLGRWIHSNVVMVWLGYVLNVVMGMRHRLQVILIIVFFRVGSMVNRCLVLPDMGRVLIPRMLFVVVLPVVVLLRVVLLRVMIMMMLLGNWLMVIIHS